MKKEPLIFLEHILKSIERIKKFTKNINKENIEKDELIQSAVIRQIEIIGEAVKNLPIEFIAKYPYIEWREIAGMRDQLTHHYFGVDLEIVWKTIKEDLPKLKENISKIIKEEENTKNGKKKESS